jgi:hypothetical protein
MSDDISCLMESMESARLWCPDENLKRLLIIEKDTLDLLQNLDVIYNSRDEKMYVFLDELYKIFLFYNKEIVFDESCYDEKELLDLDSIRSAKRNCVSFLNTPVNKNSSIEQIRAHVEYAYMFSIEVKKLLKNC